MKKINKEYTISNTKKTYCDINKQALSGIEIITSNAKTNEKVSHIKKEYLDYLLAKLKFKFHKEYDSDLKIWTLMVKELNLYGEGENESIAVDDLINSVIKFTDLYRKKIEIFSKTENIKKQVYMLKILRCNNKRELLKKELGLSGKLL